MPYRIAGQVVHDGTARVVSPRRSRADGAGRRDARRRLRVESIKADGVTLVYLPLGVREQLPVTAAMKLDTPATATASAARFLPARPSSRPRRRTRPAQLRWEGPERVQAGATSTWALKLTSDQPVRASPLQLSFDAPSSSRRSQCGPGRVLQRRQLYLPRQSGRLHFRGRVRNGRRGDGREFLMIVTFRPIRSGAAELKLSVGGAAGRRRPCHLRTSPPAAFRTASIQ